MKLCIISHTEHYKDKNGQLVGWGATITEINHLSSLFEEIFHIAMFYEDTPPPSSLPYNSSKIKFIRIPSLGGHSIKDKIKIIRNIPNIISIVNNTLEKVDFFQLRCPTGIGVFLIPYFSIFKNKKGWYKYAGNWKQKKPPLGYFIQREVLKIQNKPVTINGTWHDQSKHCITFENPTLVKKEILEGVKCIERKRFHSKINFCFVGRLEHAKGVERIIQAFNLIYENPRVGKIHFVGDGKDKNYYQNLANNNTFKTIFHGGLPREQVFKIYKQSHIFLLPSTASEGFPKVIAEALCFGCIPIVSSVSSISHYIKNDINGIIMEKVGCQDLKRQIEIILKADKNYFLKLLSNNGDLLNKFTYEHYSHRITNEILPSIEV